MKEKNKFLKLFKGKAYLLEFHNHFFIKKKILEIINDFWKTDFANFENLKNNLNFFYINCDEKDSQSKKKFLETKQNFFSKPDKNFSSKILFVENLDLATDIFQNSILIFLENFPKDLLIIFTCTNTSKILPTLKSRVQIISIKSDLKIEDTVFKSYKKIIENLQSFWQIYKKEFNNEFYFEKIEFLKKLFSKKKKNLIVLFFLENVNKNNYIFILFFLKLFIYKIMQKKYQHQWFLLLGKIVTFENKSQKNLYDFEILKIDLASSMMKLISF